MFTSQSKNKLSIQQTGIQFYNPITHQDEENFSYQIEIQKEYVQRLKLQREKIQGLYSKYDILLSEMKKKDGVIREKQERMKVMDCRVKDLQLKYQQMNLLKEENMTMINQNMTLKNRVLALQSENAELMEQIKLKQCLVSDQKNEFDQVNEQLQDKIKSLALKLAKAQEELKTTLELQHQRIQSLKADHSAITGQMSNQLSLLKNQLIRKDQALHILKLDNQFLQQKLKELQDSYTFYLKELETKIEKNQKEKKLQIKTLKDTIDEKTTEIANLESKLMTCKHQLQIKQFQLDQSKKLLLQQKKIYDDELFQVKSQTNADKLYFRQQFMYCQNHIQKLQRKLTQSLKREKQIGQRVKRFEINEVAKRNLRQIERQQMDKINKILSLQ